MIDFERMIQERLEGKRLEDIVEGISTPPHMLGRYLRSFLVLLKRAEKTLAPLYTVTDPDGQWRLSLPEVFSYNLYEVEMVADEVRSTLKPLFKDGYDGLIPRLTGLLKTLQAKGTAPYYRMKFIRHDVDVLVGLYDFKGTWGNTLRVVLRGMRKLESLLDSGYRAGIEELKVNLEPSEYVDSGERVEGKSSITLGEVARLTRVFERGVSELTAFAPDVRDAFKKLKAFRDDLDLAVKNEELKYGRGEPEELPPSHKIETLYHATTDVSGVLRTGLKRRDDLPGKVGLGGGSDTLISFTSDLDIANAIVWVLRMAVQVSKGKVGLRFLERLAKRLGVVKAFRDGLGEYGRDTPEDNLSLLSRIIAHNKRVYNPLLFGVTARQLRSHTLNNIGIVSARVDMGQVQEYLRSMQEFRVPPEAVLSVKRVAYKGVM